MKTDSEPTKPKAITPQITCTGFIPRSLGFVLRVNGARVMDANYLKRSLDGINSAIRSEFGATADETLDEVFGFVASNWGHFILEYRELEFPSSFYAMFVQARSAEIPILPGHWPLIQNWLGPVFPLMKKTEPKTWNELFDNLETFKREIADLFHFKCNYLDWCLKKDEEEAEKNSVIEATITPPQELTGATGNYIHGFSTTLNVDISADIDPAGFQDIAHILDTLPDDHPTP